MSLDQILRIIQANWQAIFLLPICFLVAGILAKYAGRRDNDSKPHPNDLAVNTTLLLMALSKISGDFVDTLTKKPNEPVSTLAGPFYWIFGVTTLLLFSMVLDRFWSWRKSNPENKAFWRGILLPDATCLIIFASYQIYRFQ